MPPLFHPRRYPFLRLVVPLIIGIVFCDFFSAETSHTFFLPSSLGTLLVAFLVVFYVRKCYSLRWLYGVAISLFFFALGIGITAYKQAEVHSCWPSGKSVYCGCLADQPQEKEKSLLCRVTLHSQFDSLLAFPLHKSVLLYLTKDSLSTQLKAGDSLLFRAQITQPHNNGNPEEFDYARFLAFRGVSGVGFAFSGDWKCTGTRTKVTVRQAALSARESVLSLYRQLGFQGDELAVLSALTLGYKEELSEAVKGAYSVSGASHILALSGLHIGILYFLLEAFLGRLFRHRTVRWLKAVLVVVVLWGFAFVTGLSPSVVRSVTMFSLLALSRLGTTPPVTMNTLALAAFVMLLYNPFYLFDVSFQLSFMAVMAILMVYPRLSKLLVFHHWFLRSVWSLMVVSVAAQLGTAPLVIYYFSRFSLFFLLTNLLVIPAATLILYFAVGMLLLGFFPFLQIGVAKLLTLLIKTLNASVFKIESMPYSSVEHLYLTTVDVWIIYLFLLLMGTYLVSKRRKYFSASVILLFLFCSFHAVNRYSQREISSIVFYNCRECPAVHFIASRQASFLVMGAKRYELKKLARCTSRFWNKLQLKEPVVIDSTDYRNAFLQKQNGVIYFSGRSVCLVNDARWQNKVSETPLNIDYLYLCKGYNGGIKPLINLFNIQKIVLDSSLNEYRLQSLKRECAALRLDFITLSEKGSLHIPL